MLNLDDHSHKEFSYGTPPEDADQDMVDCFCGAVFHPADTGHDEFCSNACYFDWVDGMENPVKECDECREPVGEPLYSMGFQFCSATCRDTAEHQMAVVYERIEEIDGMLIEQI